MTFDQILPQLKIGNMFYRVAWGGEKHIALYIPHDPQNKPYVLIFDDESYVPWNPTHADLLATDWGYYGEAT